MVGHAPFIRIGRHTFFTDTHTPHIPPLLRLTGTEAMLLILGLTGTEATGFSQETYEPHTLKVCEVLA